MATSTAQRVQKHREGLRAAGMRPVQICVPDIRWEGCALECRRQSRLSQGDCGQPRPALFVQSHLFDGHPSVTVLPVASSLRDAPLFRRRVQSKPANYLQMASEIMVDKAQSVPRERVVEVFGHVTEEQMLPPGLCTALIAQFHRCLLMALRLHT